MPRQTENAFIAPSSPKPSRKYVANTAAVKPTPTAASSCLLDPRNLSIDSRKMLVVEAHGLIPSSSPAR